MREGQYLFLKKKKKRKRRIGKLGHKRPVGPGDANLCFIRLLFFSSSPLPLSLSLLHRICKQSEQSRQRELLDRLFPKQLSACLVRAERQHSLLNLSRAGALERVLNRSETEPKGFRAKNSAVITSDCNQCALELDHRPGVIEGKCV